MIGMLLKQIRFAEYFVILLVFIITNIVITGLNFNNIAYAIARDINQLF